MDEVELSPTVIVVDDDSDVLDLSQGILLAQGLETRVAGSGAEALRLFSERPAAVVLLDVLMPELDGFETLARLRRLPGGSRAQVVIVTALGDTGTQEQAAEAGADDFLAKPFHPAELIVRVQSLLTAFRTRLELNNCLEVIRAQIDGLVQAETNRRHAAEMLAHDLRGLVFSISIGIDLTLSSAPTGSDHETLKKSRQAVTLLTSMVDDLLDLEREPGGSLALDLARVDLATLCDEVCKIMRPRFEAKQVALVCNPHSRSAECDCDRVLVTRMLCNLLDNAIGYAPPGTEVQVDIERDEAMVHVTVGDAGPGIPPELRERIFERYARFEPLSSQRRGHGLGLVFCRMVGKLHGGTVNLDDTDVGTRFRVSLPLTQ